MLREPLIEDGSQKADKYMWLRLIATVVSVSIGSPLQFGFAAGSLNNLEQVPLPRVRFLTCVRQNRKILCYRLCHETRGNFAARRQEERRKPERYGRGSTGQGGSDCREG